MPTKLLSALIFSLMSLSANASTANKHPIVGQWNLSQRATMTYFDGYTQACSLVSARVLWSRSTLQISYRQTCGVTSKIFPPTKFTVLEDGSVMYQGKKVGSANDYGFAITVPMGDHEEGLSGFVNNADGQTAAFNWYFDSDEKNLISSSADLYRVRTRNH